MNKEAFLAAYNEPRNGANEFYKHSMVRSFAYSDGVRDCALAGMYWLLDIAATEVIQVMKKKGEVLGSFGVKVDGQGAVITLLGSGDIKLWSKKIDHTDMPKGEWDFLIGDDGPRYTMILVTEY